MKKFLVVLSLLLFAVTLSAQVRTGNIYGKITDTEGNPLPGVSVKLTGTQMAGLSTVSGETGIFRFVSLSPATYEVRAELTGFKPSSQTGIVVNIGSNVEINLILEVGTLEEQITVVAQTPVVDVKKTSVGQNIDKEAMQSLPTARDPWVVLQLAPSVMVDRENVGGNESGQQSGFVAKGDATGGMGRNQGANNIWSVDGIDITDPAALGGSALYYDFDMFEELNVTTGGAADVSVQTGGIALNMVTRRGGNRTSLAGRFYLTDNFFQSDEPDGRAPGEGRPQHQQDPADQGLRLQRRRPDHQGQAVVVGRLRRPGHLRLHRHREQGPVAPQQLQHQAERADPAQQPLRGPGHVRRQGEAGPQLQPGQARRRPPDGHVPLGQPDRQAAGRARLRQQHVPVPEVLLQRRRLRLAPDDGRSRRQPHRLRQHGAEVCPLQVRRRDQLGLLRRRPPAQQLPDQRQLLQRHPVQHVARVQGRRGVLQQEADLSHGQPAGLRRQPELQRPPRRHRQRRHPDDR